MPMGSSCLRTSLISVVLPAPEGPETMNRVPSEWKLLDILNLLADALDFGLQFYNEGSQHRRARLGTHRVDLAQHFLGEEVEFLPRRLASGDRFLDFIPVVCQPCELFGDIALLDHDHRLLGDAIFVDVNARGSGDFLHALLVT